MKTSIAPADRLARSRERLRLALSGLPPAPDDPDAASQAARAAAPWWDKLMTLPGASIVMDAAQQWWASHPLRQNAMLVIDAMHAVVQPVAKRHPVALVASAFVIGGMLAWRRPLRGLLKPALFAGLLQQLLVTSMTAQAQRQQAPAGTNSKHP
jgi:hypothetical protein